MFESGKILNLIEGKGPDKSKFDPILTRTEPPIEGSIVYVHREGVGYFRSYNNYTKLYIDWDEEYYYLGERNGVNSVYRLLVAAGWDATLAETLSRSLLW